MAIATSNLVGDGVEESAETRTSGSSVAPGFVKPVGNRGNTEKSALLTTGARANGNKTPRQRMESG